MATPRKLTDHFVATEVDGELLLVDLDGGMLFSLADTARATWRLIDGARTTADIAAVLAREYDGDPAQIARDVEALVGELAAAALVAL